MKTSKTHISQDYKEFFPLFNQLSGIVVEKAKQFIIEEALIDHPEGCGFGSSDRNGAIYNALSSPSYDAETKTYTCVETVAEMKKKVDDYVLSEMIKRDLGEGMSKAFIENPEKVMDFFEVVEKPI